MKNRILLLICLGMLLSLPVLGQLHFEKSEYQARREKLMDQLPDGIAILRGAYLPSGYTPFYQYNNLMYFCGVQVPEIILVIDGRTRTSTLFFTISDDEAKGEGIDLQVVRDPGRFNGVENTLPMERFTPYLTEQVASGAVLYVPMRAEELPGDVSNEKTNLYKASCTLNEWDGRLIRELQFERKLRERFPDAAIRDCWTQISDLRKIKSKAEVDVMREAGRIGTVAHREFIRATRTGAREWDLANLFEFVCKKEGAQALAYNTIIMSGENMPYGHYHAYNRTLKDGDFVVLDAGPDYRYYDVDFSTSFPVNGKFTPEQRKVYELANEIREVCIKNYKPGISFTQVGEMVKQHLIGKGLDAEQPRLRRFIRYGGYNHSIGMAVHDGMGTFKGPDEILVEGFVFACDIEISQPDIQLDVRLEDTVVITADGCEVLSSGLPRSIQEMESLLGTKK